jgi:hypothetical protein
MPPLGTGPRTLTPQGQGAGAHIDPSCALPHLGHERFDRRLHILGPRQHGDDHLGGERQAAGKGIHWPPASCTAAAAASLLSVAETEYPTSSSRRQIGSPMRPRPITATLCSPLAITG